MKRYAFLFACIASCAQQSEFGQSSSAVEMTTSSDKLVVDIADGRRLVGSYESALGVVRFDSGLVSEAEVRAQLVVAETRIELFARRDDAAANVGFRVHGGMLEQPVRDLLDGFHTSLARIVPYPEEGDLDPAGPHEQMLRDYAGFLSEAPMKIGDELRDTRITKEDIVEPKPDRPPPTLPPAPPPPPPCSDVPDPDGVQVLNACCRGGTPMAWSHDAISNHCFVTRANWCGIGAAVQSGPTGGFGDAQCPGRCGPGCAAIPGYTQDCLDYDYCFAHDGPERCGDEWTETIDDVAYTFVIGSAWVPFMQIFCP